MSSANRRILGALTNAIEWATTLWIGIGTPPIADSAGQATGTVAFLQQNLLTYTTGLAVLCTLLGAGRIVYHEHKAAQLRDLCRYLTTYVLVSSAAAGAASVLIGGADQLASWFISRASASGSFADHLASLLGLATATASGAAGAQAGFTVGLAGTATTAFIAIVLGIVAFVATVIQIMLMLVRGGMLVMLVGTLPLAAAFSNTEIGLNWFRKATGWLIAFALYKPAAAIVYAVAFDLSGQQGALALLDGVMTLVLAILALPALLRFAVPATTALAGAGGPGRDHRRYRRRRARDTTPDRRRPTHRKPRQRIRTNRPGRRADRRHARRRSTRRDRRREQRRRQPARHAGRQQPARRAGRHWHSRACDLSASCWRRE